MKKTISVILLLAFLFAFAACKKSVQGAEVGPAYQPVTDKNGVVQTTEDYIILTDKNGELVSRVVTQVAYDDESNTSVVEVVMPVTSVVYQTLTYPSIPETTNKRDANKKTDAPSAANPGNTTAMPTNEQGIPQVQVTFAPGYTLYEDSRVNWPSAEFMQILPAYSEKVADAVHTTDDMGDVVTIRINDVSYEQYMKYIDKCKSAGFASSSSRELPTAIAAGNTDTVVFYSKSNGLWTGIRYYPYASPNRLCDMDIVITNYDPLSRVVQTETPSDNS